MGVEEQRMFDGWKMEGADAGMFIRMLDMATLVLLRALALAGPAWLDRRNSFTLKYGGLSLDVSITVL